MENTELDTTDVCRTESSVKIQREIPRISTEERLALMEENRKDLESKMSDQDSKTYAGIPSGYRLKWLKGRLGLLSTKKAIHIKCVECVGFTEVKAEISSCKAYVCPLLPYRPYK